MSYLSVKELRLQMPRVLRQLQQGKRFVLMYRSKPVGELKALRRRRAGGRGIYGFLEQPFGEVRFPAGADAASLIHRDRS